MFNINLFTRIGELLSSLGAVVAAMGCAMCFPAIASLGGALGIGFLARWEWMFINTLLPFFAGLTLLLNMLAWFAHRQWRRSLVAMLAPILLLLSLYPWFQYAWSVYVTYSALALMVILSLFDLFYPPNRRCYQGGKEHG